MLGGRVMNITSMTLEGELKAQKVCNKYKSYLDELYELSTKLEKRIQKLKLLGKYNDYVISYDFNASSETCLVQSLSRDVNWRGYEVLYIPSEVSSILLDGGINSKNLIVLGFGTPVSLDFSEIQSSDSLENLIIACDLSELIDLNDSFYSGERLKSLVIYGSIYNQFHEMTPKFTPISLKNTFMGCKFLESVIILDTDFSNLKIMDYTFCECKSLITIYFDGLKECMIDSITACFHGCESLKEIYLKGIFTHNIQSIEALFKGCMALKDINLSTITVDNVVEFTSAFENCSSLEQLDISHWKIRKRARLERMFRGCIKLKSTGNLELENRLIH